METRLELCSQLDVRVKKQECRQGCHLAGGISCGFEGEEGELSFDEFVPPTGHLRNTLSKQMGLGPEFKRKIGALDRNVGTPEPTKAVLTVAKDREKGQT